MNIVYEGSKFGEYGFHGIHPQIVGDCLFVVMIAESQPKEKDIISALVVNLIRTYPKIRRQFSCGWHGGGSPSRAQDTSTGRVPRDRTRNTSREANLGQVLIRIIRKSKKPNF